MAKTKRSNHALPLFLLIAVAALFIFWDRVVYMLGFDLLEQTTVVLRYLLGIAVWLLLAQVINQLTHILIWQGLFEERLGRPVPRLLRDMVALIIFLAAVAGIVGVVFQKSLTMLAAATGGVGVIIGLAVRDMIADVFAGLALSVEHPFRVGDFIRLETGGEGEVVSMNWRATHLRTTDNDIVVIPNNLLAARTLTNMHGAGTHFRTDIEFWLDFNVPPDRALRILNGAVKQIQNEVAEVESEYPNPISGGDLDSDAIAVDISEFGIKYRVRFWLRYYTNWSETRNRMIISVMEHLNRAGISPAYPQQDLYLTKMPERSVDESALRVSMLRNISIFAALTDEELGELATSVSRRVASAGDTIIRRGEPGESLYIIGEGLVNVLIWIETQGKEVKVANMVSGQFFGEVALLTGEPRSATIVAGTDVLLFEVTREHLMKLLQARPEIAEHMTETITAHRMRDLENIDKLTPEEQEEESKNLVQQMLGTVKKLFGL